MFTNVVGVPNCTPFTLAESEALWAQATLKGTANNVQSFQNAIAATAAMKATTPVGYEAKGLPVSAVPKGAVPGAMKK